MPPLLLWQGQPATLATKVVQWFSAVVLIAQVGSGGVETITFQHGTLSGNAARRVSGMELVLGIAAAALVIGALPGGKSLLGVGLGHQICQGLILVGTGLILGRTYGHSGAIKRALGSLSYSTSRDSLFIPIALVMVVIMPVQFRLWGLLGALGQWGMSRQLRSAQGLLPEPQLAQADLKHPRGGALQREAIAGALLALCGVGFVQLEAIVMGSALSPEQFMTYNLIIRVIAVITMSTVFVGLEAQQLLANGLAALGDSPLRARSATSRLFSRLTMPLSLIVLVSLIGLGWRLQQLPFVLLLGLPQLVLKVVNVRSGPTYPALKFNGHSEQAASWLGMELLALLMALIVLNSLGQGWGLIYACLLVFTALRIGTGVWLCQKTFGRMLWI